MTTKKQGCKRPKIDAVAGLPGLPRGCPVSTALVFRHELRAPTHLSFSGRGTAFAGQGCAWPALQSPAQQRHRLKARHMNRNEIKAVVKAAGGSTLTRESRSANLTATIMTCSWFEHPDQVVLWAEIPASAKPRDPMENRWPVHQDYSEQARPCARPRCRSREIRG